MCLDVHNHSCLLNALKNTLYTALVFNKVLAVYFLIDIIRKFKKWKNINQLIFHYLKFISRPTLFSVVFSFFARYSICSVKNRKFLCSKYGVALVSVITGTGIFAQNESKAKELSVFVAGSVQESLFQSYIRWRNIDEKEYKKYLRNF